MGVNEVTNNVSSRFHLCTTDFTCCSRFRQPSTVTPRFLHERDSKCAENVRTNTHTVQTSDTPTSSLILVNRVGQETQADQVQKARGMKFNYPLGNFPSVSIQQQYQQLKT